MKPINSNDASPKMSRRQAKLFWDSLSLEEKKNFNKMMSEMKDGMLMMTKIMVDDNEQIQRIILDPKDKPSKPAEPFYKHFQLEEKK